MTYKTKFSRQRKFPEGYWERRKRNELLSHKRTFNQSMRVGTENWSGATKRTHTVGQAIFFKKNQIATVRHVTPKGVWIEEMQGDNALDSKKSKIYFVPEKEYEKHAEPALWGQIAPSMIIVVPK